MRTTLLQYGMDFKQILLWSTEGQHYHWPYAEGNYHFMEEKCQVNKCFFTNDKELMPSSDAIMFYSTGILYDIRYEHIQQERPSQQVWVYVDQQPPTPHEDLDKLDGLFNMVISYRTDSDIVLPPGAALLTGEPEHSKSLVSNRSNTIIWHVKKCTQLEHVGITGLLKALQQQLSVSIISQCAPDPDCVIYPDLLKCQPNYDLSTYKFQLLVETQSCRDYIPEDFWDILRAGSVPIVVGSSLSEYMSAAPPNSFLHVQNFTDSDSLIQHIMKLTLHDEEYNSYITWHNVYKIQALSDLTLTSRHVVCRLCEMLHDSSAEDNYYFLSRWWSAEENCKAKHDPLPLIHR